MTINVIAWSKDRPAQLDLTLCSYKKYFKEWKSLSTSIIIKYSNDFFKKGYDRILELHPEFKYIKENDFRSDTLNLLNSSKKEYTTFIVDDDIFINDMSLDMTEFKEFDNNPFIATLSPRLHPNVNFCYTQNAPAQQPIYNEKRMWKWRENCSGDHNYPWSVAAFHIFRKCDILSLNNMQFKAPNTFEAALCNVPFTARDWMICFENAKTFTGANNRIQFENNNRNENSHPIEELNKIFLSGKRLSVNANHGLVRNMCHGPVTYIWE